MIGAAPRRRATPTVWLLAICLVLTGIVTREWFDWQEDAVTPQMPQKAAAAQPAERGVGLPPLSTFAEVLSRPLFSSTRRPADEARTPGVTTSLALIAIVISPRGPHALISHGKPVELVRVVEGQDIEGWTVDAIKFNRVILHRGGDRLELVPVDVVPARPPNPPATPPAPRSG